MIIDEKNAEHYKWGDGGEDASFPAPAAGLRPLANEDLPEVKVLIADAVLEFYGDLDFLPKDREGLLLHYERVGYLRDLDEYATVYGPGDGLFLILKEGGTVIGCGGSSSIPRIAARTRSGCSAGTALPIALRTRRASARFSCAGKSGKATAPEPPRRRRRAGSDRMEAARADS